MALHFPKAVLKPISKALEQKKHQLEQRKAELEKEDPFADPDRLNDNAAIDADAAEQFGHANIVAIKSEIDRALILVRKALTRIKIGNYGLCENCGKMIDTERLAINPTATFCIKCEKEQNKAITE